MAVDAAVTIDGRDISVDGTKLDTIETNADVTDATNVAAAGAAMSGGAFHDGFSDFVAAEHLSLPNTIANVLSDHDLAAHTALGLFDQSSDVDHDATTNFVANEHIDWTAASDAFYTTSTGRFDSYVGFGTGSTATAQVYIYRNAIDDDAKYGLYVDCSPLATSTSGYNNRTLNFSMAPRVDNAITNTGIVQGIYGEIITSGGLAGTLSDVRKLGLVVGTNTGTTGTITNLYGFYLQPWVRAGTIDNFYGIYIAIPDGAGTVTAKYAVYDNSGWDWYINGGNLTCTGDGKFTHLGISVAPNVHGIYVSTTPEDDNGYHGILVSFNPKCTSTASISNYALSFQLNPWVTLGASNTGSACAVFGSNVTDTNMAGTLRRLKGFQVQYGQNGGTGTVTYLYGLYLQAYHATGTITTAYDLLIGGPVTGGTVTNQWSIYNLNTADSYFAGAIGLGVTGPDARLEIETGATEGKQAVTIDQNDSDQVFIDFQGTSAANAANSITTWTTGNSIQGFIWVEINGVKKRMAFYDEPTS